MGLLPYGSRVKAHACRAHPCELLHHEHLWAPVGAVQPCAVLNSAWSFSSGLVPKVSFKYSFAYFFKCIFYMLPTFPGSICKRGLYQSYFSALIHEAASKIHEL